MNQLDKALSESWLRVQLYLSKCEVGGSGLSSYWDILVYRSAMYIILQSDNDSEFANRTFNNLIDMWPGMKLVHGKPWDSQSQDSIERCPIKISVRS